MSGAESLILSLQQENVEAVFGCGGPHIERVAEALRRSKAIRFVEARTEHGAGQMADGYARAAGSVGVCIAPAGSGAAGMAAAIAAASADSVPLLCITGQVPTTALGSEAYREVDIVGITRPVVKYSYLVRRASDLPDIVRHAVYLASSGRPGPVLIDLPSDVQEAAAPAPQNDGRVPSIRSYRPATAGHPRQIQKAARAIERAARPLLYCGGGCHVSECQPELVQLAERCGIPAASTLLGIGAFPGDHELSLGRVGPEGSDAANRALAACDCLIAVGARFDAHLAAQIDRAGSACRENIVQVDIDPSSLSRLFNIPFPIVGDAKEVLATLLREVRPARRDEWRAAAAEWRRSEPEAGGGLAAAALAEWQRQTGARPHRIVATDPGPGQRLAARLLPSRRQRTWLCSGGLGAGGFAFAAAMGAQAAYPDALAVAVTGSDGLNRCLADVATAADEGLAVKAFLVGGVRDAAGRKPAKGRPSTAAGAAAEAMGALVLPIRRREDVAAALAAALDSPKPAIMEVADDAGE